MREAVRKADMCAVFCLHARTQESQVLRFLCSHPTSEVLGMLRNSLSRLTENTEPLLVPLSNGLGPLWPQKQEPQNLSCLQLAQSPNVEVEMHSANLGGS